jgi:hypothetical protein
MNRKSAWALTVAASALAGYGLWRRQQSRMATPRPTAARVDATIDEASEDSFPASDPPSYTATSGTKTLR